jgi:ribosomal protein S20
MNVSSVSASPSPNPYTIDSTSGFKPQIQDFKALQSALQSGDLSGAQSAFASLQKAMQNKSQAAGANNPSSQNSQLGNDMQSLQSALQGGDLSAAQKAFASLQQDMKSASQAAGTGRAHRHHHHQGGGVQAASSTSTTSTTGTTSGNGTAAVSAAGTINQLA